MIKKIYALTLLLIASLLTYSQLVAAASSHSGKCGNNITWLYEYDFKSKQYNLFLEGYGKMYDYANDYGYNDGHSLHQFHPWDTSIPSVTISYGITSIGSYAFSSCLSLSNVEIPTTVTKIGKAAFYKCYSLENLEIPNLVTSIASSTFSRCICLKSIEIPNLVTSIGSNAFEGCTSLRQIIVYAVEPPICGEDVFKGVDKKKCILVIPEESINKYSTSKTWKDFLNISSVDSVNCDIAVSIHTENGEIIVDGIADNEVMEVYNISGAAIYRGSAKSVNVPTSGVYVVRVASKTAKVVLVR